MSNLPITPNSVEMEATPALSLMGSDSSNSGIRASPALELASAEKIAKDTPKVSRTTPSGPYNRLVDHSGKHDARHARYRAEWDPTPQE